MAPYSKRSAKTRLNQERSAANMGFSRGPKKQVPGAVTNCRFAFVRHTGTTVSLPVTPREGIRFDRIDGVGGASDDLVFHPSASRVKTSRGYAGKVVSFSFPLKDYYFSGSPDMDGKLLAAITLLTY